MGRAEIFSIGWTSEDLSGGGVTFVSRSGKQRAREAREKEKGRERAREARRLGGRDGAAPALVWFLCPVR